MGAQPLKQSSHAIAIVAINRIVNLLELPGAGAGPLVLLEAADEKGKGRDDCGQGG